MSKQGNTPPIGSAAEAIKELAAQTASLKEFLLAAAKPASGATTLRPDGTQRPAQGKDIEAGFTVKNGRVYAPDGSSTPLHLGKTLGWGEFLQDLWKVSSNPLSDESQKRMERHGSVYHKDLSSQGGTTGGYLVPPQFLGRLLSVATELSHIRPRATVLPMSTKTLQIPALDMTGGTAGKSATLGGVQATWTEEGTEIPETQPNFKQVDLTCHELSLICNTSNSLVQDSLPTLDGILTNLFAAAIAWYEDYAFLSGDGVGKPLGMRNSGAALGIARAAANSIRLADIAGMWARMMAAGMQNAVWFVSQSAIAQLIQLQGTNGDVVFIPNYGGAAPGQGGIAQNMPGTLLGRPLIITEKLPPLGSAGDILLADCSMYLIGDRDEMAMDASTHVRFNRNQTQWRAIKRVGGQPWMTAAASLADGATTVSPFVYLNA
jgi:HK97 family phage major capsid protein